MKKVLFCLSFIIVGFIFISGIFGANTTALSISKENVKISFNGASEFVKVTQTLPDGSNIDVTKTATYKSSNSDIVVAHEGRILAIDQGTAKVTVSKDGLEKTINVDVSGSKDLEKVILQTPMLTVSENERDAIINRARNMVNVKWTAKRNLVGWRGRYTFKSGKTYKGIPYSQTAYQSSYSNFKKYLGYSSFYYSYSRFGKTMPKYGSDCSGFVSMAWNISRQTTATLASGISNGTYKKVGSYNNTSPSKSSLKSSYKKLLPGDAVVSKENTHTFIIASNSPSTKKVVAYEQTPYYCLVTYWDYTTMANLLYRPFKKN